MTLTHTMIDKYANKMYSSTAPTAASSTTENNVAKIDAYLDDLFSFFELHMIQQEFQRKERTVCHVVILLDDKLQSSIAFAVIHAMFKKNLPYPIHVAMEGVSIKDTEPHVVIHPVTYNNVGYTDVNTELDIDVERDVDHTRLAESYENSCLNKVAALTGNKALEGLVPIDCLVSSSVETNNITSMCCSSLRYRPSFIFTGTTLGASSSIGYTTLSTLMTELGDNVTVGSPLSMMTLSDALSILAMMTQEGVDPRDVLSLPTPDYQRPLLKLNDTSLDFVTAFVNVMDSSPLVPVLAPVDDVDVDAEPVFELKAYPIATSSDNLAKFIGDFEPYLYQERVTASFKILTITGK